MAEWSHGRTDIDLELLYFFIMADICNLLKIELMLLLSMMMRVIFFYFVEISKSLFLMCLIRINV